MAILYNVQARTMPATKTKEQKELKAKTNKVIKILKAKYGDVKTFLTHKNAFELLCAVSLSAQCTDDRVNLTTLELFRKYPTPEKLAVASLKDVERVIKSCNFYRNKAKNLIKMANQLLEHHNGEVPNNIDDLVLLGGVGRKTANVILGAWFNEPEGVVVDTHVLRITNMLGLTDKKEPVKAELDLNELITRKVRDQFSLWLIKHGRDTCIARRPKCTGCELNKLCDFYQNKK